MPLHASATSRVALASTIRFPSRNTGIPAIESVVSARCEAKSWRGKYNSIEQNAGNGNHQGEKRERENKYSQKAPPEQKQNATRQSAHDGNPREEKFAADSAEN